MRALILSMTCCMVIAHLKSPLISLMASAFATGAGPRGFSSLAALALLALAAIPCCAAANTKNAATKETPSFFIWNSPVPLRPCRPLMASRKGEHCPWTVLACLLALPA